MKMNQDDRNSHERTTLQNEPASLVPVSSVSFPAGTCGDETFATGDLSSPGYSTLPSSRVYSLDSYPYHGSNVTLQFPESKRIKTHHPLSNSQRSASDQTFLNTSRCATGDSSFSLHSASPVTSLPGLLPSSSQSINQETWLNSMMFPQTQSGHSQEFFPFQVSSTRAIAGTPSYMASQWNGNYTPVTFEFASRSYPRPRSSSTIGHLDILSNLLGPQQVQEDLKRSAQSIHPTQLSSRQNGFVSPTNGDSHFRARSLSMSSLGPDFSLESKSVTSKSSLDVAGEMKMISLSKVPSEKDAFPTIKSSTPTSQTISGPQLDDTSASEYTPRRQEVRNPDDLYTPRWVRLTGAKKEGLCEDCEAPGRWLQLKNSAYWYHKQFVHGISSSTKTYFEQPRSIRFVWEITEASNEDVTPRKIASSVQIATEGLCHGCNDWAQVGCSKRRIILVPNSPQQLVDNIQRDYGQVQGSSVSPQSFIVDSRVTNGQSSYRLLAKVENGHIVLPKCLASFPQNVLRNMEQYERDERGMTILWYRHAHKCHSSIVSTPPS